jgi:hypothetical protein
MLQTRAGVCPNCKDETPSGAERCPSCGFHLEWGRSNDEQRARTATSPRAESTAAKPRVPKKKAPLGLRLFVLFVIACAAIMAAVTFRSHSKDTGAPELVAEHATLVQDAEQFRDQVRANVTNPEATETTFVIGIAMPNSSDVLEITVRNEWKSLDYATRLGYAAKLVERWKAIHAPHRANMTLLDEGGNEIGGRTWNGTVWVQEQHEEGTVAPAKPPANAGGDATANATPNSTPNAAENSVTNSAEPRTENSVEPKVDEDNESSGDQHNGNEVTNSTSNSVKPEGTATPGTAPGSSTDNSSTNGSPPAHPPVHDLGDAKI